MHRSGLCPEHRRPGVAATNAAKTAARARNLPDPVLQPRIGNDRYADEIREAVYEALGDIVDAYLNNEPALAPFKLAIARVDTLAGTIAQDCPREDLSVRKASHFWCWFFGDLADALDPSNIADALAPAKPSPKHFAHTQRAELWTGRGYGEFAAAYALRGAIKNVVVEQGVTAALATTGLGTVRSAAMSLQVLVCPDVPKCDASNGVYKKGDGLMQDALAEDLRDEVLGG